MLNRKNWFRHLLRHKISQRISDAFRLEKFINNSQSVLILGDNIFYGTGLANELAKANKEKKSSIFTYKVSDPENFVYLIRKEKSSKNQKFISNDAAVGIYFMDKNNKIC